jgi:hypothetical protein
MIGSRSNLEQQAADEFHMMVGYCIAEWARVDDELFRIFQACLGAAVEQCSIIYYRLAGLNLRLDMVDEIVKSILPKRAKTGEHEHPDVKKWSEIAKSFRDLLGTRRRIAHHPVQPRFEMKPYFPPSSHYLYLKPPFGMTETLQPSFEIYVSQNEQARGGNAKSIPLTIVDLQSHFADTVKLHSSMNGYFHDILSPALTRARQASPQ